MLSISIIFPAILVINQFKSQIVELGGIYPKIEIELVNSTTGLHEFKIMKSIKNFTPTLIASVVKESEIQMEYFLNILAYISSAKIILTGKIFYKTDNGRQEFNPIHRVSSLNGIVLASELWFEAQKVEFHKSYNLDLLKQYNFCQKIDEPISGFISLYTLLLSLSSPQKQAEVDKLIESIDSNIGKFISPNDRKPETLFTKLRNELAHYRAGVSVVETHRNIELHLPRFDSIVREIISSKVELTK